VGIRPEHLLIGESGAGCPLHVKLHQMERLGDSSLLYAQIQPGLPLVTVRVEGAAPQVSGERMTLRLRAEECHLFDAEGQAFARTVPLPT
jgi:multiple sugar transport system ATP-binding protein